MTPVATHAETVVRAHFQASCDAAAAFFASEADAIATACEAIATRFASGGTLFVLGEGAQASDAHHISVEFVHPIIVGKRCLPAIALTGDRAGAEPLKALLRPNDILLALSVTNAGQAIERALAVGRECGALTLLFSGEPSLPMADVRFYVPQANPMIVQEVHETLYHVLWELVHVFLDHSDVGSASTAAGSAASAHERALYPFLFDDAPARPLDSVREEVRQSILAKSRDICALRENVAGRSIDAIGAAGQAIRARVDRGGRLLAFGNGGSATDAQDAVADCMAPPVPGWNAIPALALTDDIGVVTAVANDVGFDHVYTRQILAFGGPNDIALGISTSGTSRSIITALEAAKARGLLTIALVGNDGGTLARSSAVDICVTVPSDYTPRIQEAHATIWHAMLSVAQEGGEAR